MPFPNPQTDKATAPSSSPGSICLHLLPSSSVTKLFCAVLGLPKLICFVFFNRAERGKDHLRPDA